jgi:predicted double-glycine peptidase
MDLFESKVRHMLDQTYQENINQCEDIRAENAEILYNLYKNDFSNIKADIIDRMIESGVYSAETIKEFIALSIINPVPKALSNLCSVYSQEPKRKIILGEKENADQLKIYSNLLNSNHFNSTMKEVHKLGYLYKTLIVKPTIRKNELGKDELYADILYPYQIQVDADPNNPMNMFRLAIKYTVPDPETGKVETFAIIWTKDEHYKLKANGDKEEIEVNGKKNNYKNPYGFIPAKIIRFDREVMNFWGYPMDYIVDQVYDLCIISFWLSRTTPSLIGGIPVFENVDFDAGENDLEEVNYETYEYQIDGVKKTKVRRTTPLPKIRFSPINALKLFNKNNQEAKFYFANPETNLTEIQAFVDWRRNMLLNDLGISKNAYQMQQAAQSGYAKQMEETETIAARQEHIPYLREFEEGFFEMAKQIMDVDGVAKLNSESKLKIDYPEVTFPKTADEITKERDSDIKYNLKSPVDYIMENNPDLTREEAEAIYEENKRLNGAGRISVSVDGQSENTQTAAAQGGKGSDNVLSFPDLRQNYDFTCGASSLQGVFQYYGEDAIESDLATELGTDPDWGTEPAEIEKVAIAHGYEVESREMTIDEVKQFIDQKYPVILDIQAWHGDTDTAFDYTDDYEDGHYVVVVGYDDSGFILEDPSDEGRSYMKFDELEKRWHDVDKQGNKFNSLGIVIKGEPKYSLNQYKTIG